MKTHTQNFKEEIKLLGKQQEVKITYTLNNEQIELTSEDINSITPYYEGSLLKSVMKQLDIDSNINIPEGTEIRFKYGLLVNGEYEYLDYGNYIVYTSEKQEDTGSYSLVCYDKMLYFMKDYESLGLTYPVTVREYIIALCTKLGLTFKNANDTFPNYDKQLTSDLFEGIGFTYRDVADDLAEAIASTICLDINDEVELRDINTAYELQQKSGSPIHINNSIEAPLQHFRLNGGSKQETREGSNYFNINDLVKGMGALNVDEEDFVTVSLDNSSGTSQKYYNVYTNPSKLIKPNTKYYLVLEVKEVSGTGNIMVHSFNQSDHKPQFSGSKNYVFTNLVAGDIKIDEITSLEDFSDSNSMLRTFLSYNAGQSGSITFRISVLEEEPTEDTFKYEQYGAMPSPNYPSKIETVGSNVNELEYPFVDTTKTTNGITFTDNGDGAIIANGTATENAYFNLSKPTIKAGKHILSGIPQEASTSTYFVKFGTVNITSSYQFDWAEEFTPTESYIRINKGVTVNNLVFKIKLEEGNQATPYSPYGMGSVEIGVCNKNFLKFIETDKTQSGLDVVASNNSIEVSGTSTASITLFNIFEDIRLKKGTYTFSFNAQNPPSANSTQFILCKEDGIRIKTLNAWGNTSSSVITLEEDTIISSSKSYFYVNKNITFNNTKYELQIEKGESATEIIEHQSQTKIMPIQQEMLEGDYIEDVEHHGWKKIILNGTENITQNSNKNLFVYMLPDDIAKFVGADIVPEILSNQYAAIKFDDGYSGEKDYGITFGLNSGDRICIRNKDYSTIEELKTALATNNLTIYYQLATPIDLELTEEQKEAKKINTYNNVTNIVADNELATLDVEYATSIETIDEEYLKDTNVNFGEKYGPINSIVLSRAESDNVYLQDEESIQKNGLCELKIKDNQIMNFNDRSDYLPDLLNKLKGIEFYLNDFTSTGIMFLELLDRYNVKVAEKIYSCVMFNNEQDITQGLEEQVYTEIPETGETDYTKADKTDQKINQTNLIVDKQNQQIQGIITQIGDRSEKETSITADIDGLSAKVEQIEDVTNNITGTKVLTLENCVAGDLLELHIYGNNTVFDYLLPSDTLYPSNTLYPKGDSRISVINYPSNSEEGTETGLYELGVIEVLRQNENVCDEYVLKDGQAKIIRRINKDGTVKATETIEDLGTFSIPLLEGDNEIVIKNYSAKMEAKWAIKNDYTDIFTTKVEMNSSITQTAQEINLEVSKKVDENEIISKINQSAEQISIKAEKISLSGKTLNLEDDIEIISENFKVDKNGNMEANNGRFIGGEIILNGGTNENPVFKVQVDDNGSEYTIINPTGLTINKSASAAVSIGDIGANDMLLSVDGDSSTFRINTSSQKCDLISMDLSVLGNVTANEYNYNSLESIKKNIEAFKENAINIIKNADIYEFNYKTENDKDKKHIGFIIGKNYNTPKEVVAKNNESIDTYTMSAICWKAIQEQQKQIEEMQKEIEKLKGEK